MPKHHAAHQATDDGGGDAKPEDVGAGDHVLQSAAEKRYGMRDPGKPTVTQTA